MEDRPHKRRHSPNIAVAETEQHAVADNVGCWQEQQAEWPADFREVTLTSMRFTVGRCDVVADCRAHQHISVCGASGAVLARGVFWRYFQESHVRRTGMSKEQGVDREVYWQGVIRQQESSGLSISAFCRQTEVAEGSFFYWRRKLTTRPSQKESTPNDKMPRQSRPRRNAVAKFVPVDIPAPSARSGGNCEVVLPNACRIIVPMQCDAGWLREILEALGEQSC